MEYVATPPAADGSLREVGSGGCEDARRPVRATPPWRTTEILIRVPLGQVVARSAHAFRILQRSASQSLSMELDPVAP
jgi:hypothetical protein